MPCESKYEDIIEEESKACVESRKMQNRIEEEEKRSESKYEELDEDLIYDMQNGDGQMRRLTKLRMGASWQRPRRRA